MFTFLIKYPVSLIPKHGREIMHLENRTFTKTGSNADLDKWFLENFARIGLLEKPGEKAEIKSVSIASTGRTNENIMCVWATVWFKSEDDYKWSSFRPEVFLDD